MSLELKIKSKHLACESKIIRKEELKLNKAGHWTSRHKGAKAAEAWFEKQNHIAHHRRYDVRNEARAIWGDPKKEVKPLRRDRSDDE